MPRTKVTGLTDRQRTVLSLIREGRTFKEIANLPGQKVEEQTIRHIATRLTCKFGVNSVHEAAVIAEKDGLITLQEAEAITPAPITNGSSQGEERNVKGLGTDEFPQDPITALYGDAASAD